MESMAVHVVLQTEDEHYTAHCLEFDLVAQGADADEAFRNVLDAISLQAAFSEEQGDPGLLIRPAPAEYWLALAAAQPYSPQPNGWILPPVLSHVDCGLVAA